MKKIHVRRLIFGSYIKFFFFSGIAFGIVFGVLALILSLFGAPVYAYVGNITFYGLTAGVLSFIFSPLLCGAIFAWFALVMFLPFKLLTKIFNKLKFTALIEEPQEPESPQDSEELQETQR